MKTLSSHCPGIFQNVSYEIEGVHAKLLYKMNFIKMLVKEDEERKNKNQRSAISNIFALILIVDQIDNLSQCSV